ncbi:LuxR family transcriptional regulator [Glaciihabitans arcticus]|nr:LuxR family transcriptional regulator [Glaciihabitans arcticus]
MPPVALPPERLAIVSRLVSSVGTPGTRSVILGESGVGKSAVLDAVVEQIAAREGVIVLYTRADLGPDRLPFQIVHDLLAEVNVDAIDMPRTQRDALAHAAGRARSDGPLVPAHVHQAMDVVVRALAREAQVVVVFDDIDRLDPDSLELARFLIHRPTTRAQRPSYLASRTLGDAAHMSFARCSPSEVVTIPPLQDPLEAVLTPRELLVARSAAEGATNREIAERLFVSVRTVETQLSAAYRKLGLRSRSELTGAAR